MDLKNRTVAVIGLGYVGLPLAVEFGRKRTVIGFDIDANRIAELENGFDHTLEVSSDELKDAKYLRFTSDPESLRSVEDFSKEGKMIFIITVPTPVDKSNRPDFTPLVKASMTVGKVLKPGDVVIYESTVYPGATEEVCVPILEKESRLKFISRSSPLREENDPIEIQNLVDITQKRQSNAIPALQIGNYSNEGLAENKIFVPKESDVGFFCAYSPERINPGDKKHRLPDIKKITSGSTPEVAKAVDELYKEIITAGTYPTSSIKVAEAAKIIENAQRDLNIAFVNELSLIFARMSIDTNEVLTAAATKWNFLPFKPGLVGGHCIGVDPYYLTYKAQELGYQPQVILSGRAINDDMGRYAARNVIRLMIKNGINVSNATVGVLGITFKENCPDVRNSKVIDIIHELEDWGVKTEVMDPWADSQQVFDEYGLVLANITPEKPVDSIIIAVNHQEFASILPRQLKAMCISHAKPIIGDLKALFDIKDLESVGFEVFRL